MALDQNIGMVTAYAYAVSKGYTGTEEQFAQELASAGADLSQIQTQIDNFINTIVPAKTAEVTAEGTRQIGLVAAEGTAQKNAVTEEGTTQKNAVISEGTTQKNAVNSAGSTQVNAVNSAGSTQVGNVNTAGSTQVGAVQAKGQEVINSIPSDYTALSDDVDDLKNAIVQKAPVIISHAESTIASFSDGADGYPVENLTVNIEYKSSGWTGVGITNRGKNIVGLNTSPANQMVYSNVVASDHSDSSVTLTSSNSSYATMYLYYRLKAGTYTASVKAESSDSYTPVLSIYKTGNVSLASSISQANPKTFTLSEDTDINIRFYVTTATATVRTVRFYDFQLEQSSTVTPYEPYTSQTYSIDWASEAGTVYGGTLDVTTGLLTSTLAADGSPIATPVIYQLTPTEVRTLLGYNNIYADTGASSVDYCADTKLYIDGLSQSDDDMIADANIASGKYFTVNNKLYLSTTAIAQGASIVVGTNCTETNLAEALNALNA